MQSPFESQKPMNQYVNPEQPGIALTLKESAGTKLA
jgi:hypothetical protein